MAHVISLEALRVLDEIEKKGSFAAAAEALFKVPSALSYTIQKLESDLNVNLFDRTKQRAQFTAAGRLMLERGRHLLQAASSLEEAVQQLEAGWEVELRIAKDTILPLAPLLEVVAAFQQLDKQVAIDIREEVLGGTWEALLHERCDIAIGASGEVPKGVLEVRPMGEVAFVFAVSKDHPLRLHAGPVDAAAILAFPTVIAGDSSIASPLRSSSILESRQCIRVANMVAKIETQKMGLGVGFLPTHMIQQELQSGELVALPCSVPRPKIPLFIAWRKGSEGRALAWFAQALQKLKWCAQ